MVFSDIVLSMFAHSLSVSHVEQDLYIQDLHHAFNKNNLKKKSAYLFYIGGWGFQLLCQIQIPQTLAHTLALITIIWSVHILNATFVFLLTLSRQVVV